MRQNKSSRFLRFVTSPILFLLEYFLKILAGVSSILVLGGQGSFFNKLATGYSSLIDVLYRIAAWPEKFSYITTVIRDYNSLTASAFNQRYGSQAINQVMDYLNETVFYFQTVYQNLAEQPISTVLATIIAFLSFYILARTMRFIRQRGEGSYLTRKEREFGDRVFRSSEE
ncbi:MAG: hypothetical protein WD599_00340 [Balneolaceae bacterium]